VTIKQQIEKLANFIMAEIPGEPSQDEGAVDTIIRVHKALQKAGIENWWRLMRNWKRFITSAILVTSLALLTTCGIKNVTLPGVAKTLRATSLGISIFQDIAIAAHEDGKLDRATTEKLLDFSFLANQIGLEVSTFVRTLENVTSEDRTRINQMLIPLLDTIERIIDITVAAVEDSNVREQLESALLLIRITIISLGG